MVDDDKCKWADGKCKCSQERESESERLREREKEIEEKKKADRRAVNRHKATAQRMPGGRKQDWGDQPLFDQSDLYVIPEALIYEIFGGILSSMPSSSE